MRIVISILTILAATPMTIAATSPSPGCNAAEYRQLDFWLGDWDSFESDNPTVSIARTHIDLIAAGCALHERYEQTDGLIGDSILSFDAARKVWQQTWVTNRGSLMVIAGRFKDGALTLQGEMHVSDGRSLLQRVTWTAQGSDVREWSVMSKDGGKTWQPAFDVIFRKHQ